MSKPVVYQDETNDLSFLTDTEKSFLRMDDAALRKMLLKRAKMFQTMHRSWREFLQKENTYKLLTRTEWKDKIYKVLNLTFKMTDAQVKGVVDQYWLRVDLPKEGIKQ